MRQDARKRGWGPVGRVFVLLRRPSVGWDQIKAEPPNAWRLATYGLIGGSLGPVSRATGSLVFGLTLNGVVYRPPVLAVLLEAGVSYGLALLLGLGFAFLATVWSVPFGGVRHWSTGLAISVFSSMSGWIGGILYIFPPLAFLTALTTLYGVFVFYCGAQRLVEPCRGRLTAYVAVVLVCYIVLAIGLTRALRSWIASL